MPSEPIKGNPIVWFENVFLIPHGIKAGQFVISAGWNTSEFNKLKTGQLTLHPRHVASLALFTNIEPDEWYRAYHAFHVAKLAKDPNNDRVVEQVIRLKEKCFTDMCQ